MKAAEETPRAIRGIRTATLAESSIGGCIIRDATSRLVRDDDDTVRTHHTRSGDLVEDQRARHLAHTLHIVDQAVRASRAQGFSMMGVLRLVAAAGEALISPGMPKETKRHRYIDACVALIATSEALVSM